MAVNIDQVYKTVLTIINKEQRGYITPDEFNDLANQAQQEIFEGYFGNKHRSLLSKPMANDDYADTAMNLEEKITFFDNSGSLDVDPTTSGFYAYSGLSNFYRLGIVSVSGRQADEVSHKDILYTNLSPLTAPTVKQPVYTRHEGGIFVYPLADVSSINVTYIRRPSDVLWAFLNAPTGEPIYDAANSVDFELHPSEQSELVIKILGYAGVVIREPDVTSIAAQKDVAIQNNEQ